MINTKESHSFFYIAGIILIILMVFSVILLITAIVLTDPVKSSSLSWAFWTSWGVTTFTSIVGIALLGGAFLWEDRLKQSLRGAIHDKKVCDKVAGYCSKKILPVSCSEINFDWEKGRFNPSIAKFCGKNIYHLEIFCHQYMKRKFFAERMSTVILNEFPLPNGIQTVGVIQRDNSNFDYRDPIVGIVFICKKTNTLYMIFRGTLTFGEWKKDFEFDQAKLCCINSNHCFKTCNQNVLVHKGFLRVFSSIEPSLSDCLLIAKQGFNINRVIVAGHSLGGALTSLAGFYIASHPDYKNMEIQCYTFGKPRVGNIEYSDTISTKRNLDLFRIENENDVVTQLPLASTPNFDEPEKPFIFQHEGTSFKFDNNTGSMGLNHYMPIYLKVLNLELQ